jgi:hypothetical protein
VGGREKFQKKNKKKLGGGRGENKVPKKITRDQGEKKTGKGAGRNKVEKKKLRSELRKGKPKKSQPEMA